jgi:shikimate dehydrogenase
MLHGFWLDKAGVDARYAATAVRTDQLGDFLASRQADSDWRGCNVTVPHKQAVIPYLDALAPLASQVGAVNVIIPHNGLTGGNSDVDGVTASLPNFAAGELRQVCLIGSGGAALAALAAFRSLGVERVTLNVRDRAKGERVLGRWGFAGRVGAIDDHDNIAGSQLIVNATTLGMQGQTPMPDTLLQHIASHPDDRAVVFDMVYAPLETALLQAAQYRGLRTVDGLSMLINQAASAFESFFGHPAPRDHDAELRVLLTS